MLAEAGLGVASLQTWIAGTSCRRGAAGSGIAFAQEFSSGVAPAPSRCRRQTIDLVFWGVCLAHTAADCAPRSSPVKLAEQR